MKLNIGAGSTRREGFLSVDVRADAMPDIVSDAWGLETIDDGSVDEIYTRHMLEHLDPNDARRTLARWFQALRSGGTLNIVVPDLEFHCRQLLGSSFSTFADQQAHAFAGFFGWRDESRGGNREDAHRWGYTERTMTALLSEFGYRQIARQLSGIDCEPWHLNMTAIKP